MDILREIRITPWGLLRGTKQLLSHGWTLVGSQTLGALIVGHPDKNVSVLISLAPQKIHAESQRKYANADEHECIVFPVPVDTLREDGVAVDDIWRDAVGYRFTHWKSLEKFLRDSCPIDFDASRIKLRPERFPFACSAMWENSPVRTRASYLRSCYDLECSIGIPLVTEARSIMGD